MLCNLGATARATTFVKAGALSNCSKWRLVNDKVLVAARGADVIRPETRGREDNDQGKLNDKFKQVTAELTFNLCSCIERSVPVL